MYSDRNGLDVAIVVGGPTGYGAGDFDDSGNPFGHTGIGVEGEGAFSFGTGTDPGSSFTDYLTAQSAYRDSSIFEIETTPAQDVCIANELHRLPKTMPSGIASMCDNCNSRVADALVKCGISVPKASRCFPAHLRTWLKLQSLLRKAKRTDLPQGATVSGFSKYDP
jgi:hypothetical protein